MYTPIEPMSILDYLQTLLNAASIKLPDPNQDRFIRAQEVFEMTGPKQKWDVPQTQGWNFSETP